MRVLVIDDHKMLREGAAMVLIEHEVVLAASGERGLELAALEEFDVVLCDLQMPGIDGLEVQRRLPEGLRDRFVLWTGAPEGLEGLGIRVLSKPVAVEELREAIREAGGRREVVGA